MACLIRQPGGSNNRGGYGKGKYYVRLRLPSLKKYRLIPLGTENEREAKLIFKKINRIEHLRKAETLTLKAMYEDYLNDNKMSNEIDDIMGFDQSVSLSHAIEKYINSCKNRVSKGTVNSYKLALGDLEKSLKASTRITELNKRDYDRVLSHLEGNYNGTTVNIRLRGIRAFLIWLVDNDYLLKLPFNVKMIKLKESLPKFITPDEMNAIYSQITDPIMVSIIKVYEATGMRLSELKTSILESGKFLRVVGKGKKERIIPIPRSLLNDYRIAISSEYKTDRITKAFTYAKRSADIKGEKTLHSLRHTFALRKLVELGDIYLVQKLLGHSSVTVTEIYTKFPIDYLKEVFNSKIKTENVRAVA